MDEEENVNLCTTAIVIRKSPHSLILANVVFARCIIKDGSRTTLPIAHITQSSTCVRPYLHVAHGNIYTSTWEYTQKHNHMFKYLLFDWLAHLTKLDG